MKYNYYKPSVKLLIHFFFIKYDAHLQAKVVSSSSRRGSPSMFTISKPITKHLNPNEVPLSWREYFDAHSKENITSLPTFGYALYFTV